MGNEPPLGFSQKVEPWCGQCCETHVGQPERIDRTFAGADVHFSSSEPQLTQAAASWISRLPDLFPLHPGLIVLFLSVSEWPRPRDVSLFTGAVQRLPTANVAIRSAMALKWAALSVAFAEVGPRVASGFRPPPNPVSMKSIVLTPDCYTSA